MNPRIQRLVSQGRQLQREIWRRHGDELSRRQNSLYAVLRIASITWAGLRENRIIIRSAALSFSSLLGLGPVIALMVLVSGFVLDQSDPDIAQRAIERAVTFIAPQVNLSSPDAPESGGNQGLNKIIADFIEASKSGAVGIGGSLVLVLIVIQLFITIEDAFNDIWGVSKGRKLITRVVLYWTVITLGTVLVFAGLAMAVTELIKLNAQLAAFAEGIPGSAAVGGWVATYGGKLLAYTLVTAVLTLFYRFIPNTQVEWKAALVGGVFTTICILLNNAFAFLYIERVAMQRTLYGSLSILPILMIGLYIFWLCLLLGGRLSFAVQNARFRSGQVVWDELSQASKESLCLLLFSQVCRRFQSCEDPLSTTELASTNNLPRPLTNAAMDRLVELGFASALPPKEHDAYNALRYQPARPLDKLRLIDFKRSFESFGETPDEDLFATYEPLVERYHQRINSAREDSFEDQSFETALRELEQDSK